MEVLINDKMYNVNNLEEINTLVPPEEIVTLVLSYLNISKIPENIFKYNTNLEYLDLGDNELTNLPENIFQYNTKLIELDLRDNKLKELPENISKTLFRYNTNLQVLSLCNNMLTELPENIFKFNTNLQKLYLYDNELINLPENIFKNNTNLQELYLNNNELRQLPISLLNCNRLQLFIYDNNELNYIPPNMQRFLNRLENNSNDLQIYNDGQNVHNHMIQESVKNSINNILSIPKIIDKEKIMQYIVDSKLSDTSKRLILEYCNDTTIHTVLCVTFEETLHHMFQYIVDHLPDKMNNIINILDTEMQDSECKCFTGRISRLINCLGGISDLVEVKIPENMERSNIVLMLREKYSGQELIDNIVKEFTERGYQEHIEEYIEAL